MGPPKGALDLDCASVPPGPQRFRGGRHGLTQLVRQHEGLLVLYVEVARESEHTLALHLVAEHHDGHQAGLQRPLVPAYHSTRRRRESARHALQRQRRWFAKRRQS